MEKGGSEEGPCVMNVFKKNQNRVYIGVTIAAIVLAAILVVNYGVNKKAEEEESTRTVTSIEEKEKKDKVLISTNTAVIKEGLSNMGTLITQEYYFTQVETYTKEKNIFIVIPTKSGFTYSYDGSVIAGVDFGEIDVKTDEDRKIITVDLPPSEIQSVNIDRDTFKIYSEKESLWNPLKLEDYNISLAEFEESAKEKALENGILERSDAQAQKLVSEFIGSLPNASGYTVDFEREFKQILE